VAGKPVAGKLGVVGAHEGVARDLGDDRGGGDRGAARVAVGERFDRRLLDPGEAQVVGQVMVGRLGQRFQSAADGQKGCLINVDSVDFGGGGGADADGQRLGANADGEFLARVGREHLRVGQAVDADAGRKDDGRGNDGSGQRPAAGLVDAGDALGAARERLALVAPADLVLCFRLDHGLQILEDGGRRQLE